MVTIINNTKVIKENSSIRAEPLVTIINNTKVIKENSSIRAEPLVTIINNTKVIKENSTIHAEPLVTMINNTKVIKENSTIRAEPSVTIIKKRILTKNFDNCLKLVELVPVHSMTLSVKKIIGRLVCILWYLKVLRKLYTRKLGRT